MSGRAEIAVYAPGQLNESYTIDPWGNMLPSGSVSNPNLSFAVNNRYELPASYDDSGNLVSIGGNSYCGAGQTYVYNAEAQMSCGEGVNYTYDGDGARVKKSSGTLYWGGDAGSALTESDLSGTITSEYVFLNGKRIARQDAGGAVYYYFTDMLGSSNVVTDANGVTLNESDIWPFGVEHVILDNLTNQHYKYTGKERDAESGNDYFGARYYASSMGRFLSPDWSAQEDPVPYANLEDPQTLNLYAYVGNNPLGHTDPDGHIIDTLLDIAFVAYDGYKIAKEGFTAENSAALTADLACALLPVATGGGLATRAAFKAEHVLVEGGHVVEATRAVERGRKSEKAVLEAEGLTKNTKGFQAVDSKTGKVGTTIPDSMRSGSTVEIKDVNRLSDSPQLRRQSEISRQAGQKAEVITGKNTKVSKTVERRMKVRRRNDLGPR